MSQYLCDQCRAHRCAECYGGRLVLVHDSIEMLKYAVEVERSQEGYNERECKEWMSAYIAGVINTIAQCADAALARLRAAKTRDDIIEATSGCDNAPGVISQRLKLCQDVIKEYGLPELPIYDDARQRIRALIAARNAVLPTL